MRKFFGSMGSVSRVAVESQVLKSNMLGDPSERVLDVYVPAGRDGQGLPLLVDLVGFTSSGLSHTNWAGFRENLPERLDRLIGEQHMPPVVDAQSIYSFRAATVRNILDFPKQFRPPAHVVTLEQNYRSTECGDRASNRGVPEGTLFRQTVR